MNPVEAQNLNNHWTTREVPCVLLVFSQGSVNLERWGEEEREESGRRSREEGRPQDGRRKGRGVGGGGDVHKGGSGGRLRERAENLKKGRRMGEGGGGESGQDGEEGEV